MRIIVVLTSLYTGGAEFSTLSFYGWLVKRGYAVKLVCLKKVTPCFDPEQFGVSDVEFIDRPGFVKKLRILKKIIKAFKPQLVHSVLFDANLLTRMARITSRKFLHLESLVNEMYSSFRLSDPRVTKLKLEGYRCLDRLTQYNGVDHFHANGISLANHYQQKLGIATNRITIIPRGRQANAFVGDGENREWVRKEFQTNSRLLVVSVGRHEYQKGQDVLLEALRDLKPEREKIMVVIAGREGNQTESMKKMIKAYDLETCVMLAGYRSDVSSLLAAADVFVFPSRFEGLPGALIESEAAGLPIVCSDIPNNREVAVENENALFFPVNEAHVLGRQLKRVVNDETLRRKMADESLRIFRNRFSMDDAHQRMEKLLLQLISKSATR